MHAKTIDACRVAAKAYKVPLSTVMAVVETESNGVTFADVHGRPEPLIRWEGHYFDKRLSGDEQARARKLGLASPKAGAIANPSSQEKRYDLLARAAGINKEAAYESISIGVGQVMGAHDSKLGFPSAVAMLEYARKGATEQVDLMMRYCKEFGLLDELQRGDFAGFARGYNGPNYKKYAYDTTMKKHAKKFAKYDEDSVGSHDGVPVAKPVEAAATEGMLRMGTSGARVRDLQIMLNRAAVKYGLTVIEVDGDYGPTTQRAVKAFQKAAGFTGKDIDGIAGPATLQKLERFRADPDEDAGAIGPIEAVTETTEGRQGAAGAVTGTAITAGVDQAKDALYPVTGSGGWVDTIYAVLTILGVVILVGGLLYVGYGWWKAKQTHGVKEE